MEKLLISACLAGEKVRYNGQALPISEPLEEQLSSYFELVRCCPEVASGMPIPRASAEIIDGPASSVLEQKAKVKDNQGHDVTDAFVRGANMALQLCLSNNIRFALLAEGSPSCGSFLVYDGTFSGVKMQGRGVTAELLTQHGITVFNVNTIQEFIDQLPLVICNQSFINADFMK